MTDWLDDYSTRFGARILKNRSSIRRIQMMTGLTEEKAKLLSQHVRKDKGSASVPTKPEAVKADASFFLEKQYVYNEAEDTYVTFLPDVPKPLVLSGDVHREIVRAYSNFNGNPATINEIARTVQLPRAWIVRYLRAHEITHDREPFTPEEVLSRPEEDLIEDALQIRRAGLYKKLEKAKWAAIQDDAMKWRSYEDQTLRALTQAVKSAPAPQPRIRLRSSTEPHAAVLGLTDYHWGKYSDPQENFEPYNRKIARERLFSSTERLISLLENAGRPEKIYVPVGSDFLHIDNDHATTTKGTPQDTDGTPAELLVSGCHLMGEWVDLLQTIASIELVLMTGNHDKMMGLSILLYLEALYKNNPHVTVHRDRTPRVYHTYGANLLGFSHGEHVHRTQDLAGHMSRECAQAWAVCPHRTIYTGHKHHEHTETDQATGVVRRQLPSIAGTDRWHSSHGYLGNPKSLPMFLHGKEHGLFSILYGTP